MAKKNGSVIVVDSSGFSDKRIKFDGVSVDGEAVKDYLDRLVIDEVAAELEDEADSVNTVYRKPRLRYTSEVEQPGKVKLMTKDDVAREIQIEAIKKELPLINSNLKYVVASFLTGETFNYTQLHNFIKVTFDKDVPIERLQQMPSIIKKSRISFLLKKVGSNPVTYAFDPRAKAFSLLDTYDLYQKSGISLEAFCGKYPITLDILKDKGIDLTPDNDAATGNVDADTGVPEELADEIHVRPVDNIDMSDEEYQALVDEMKKDEPEDKPTWQGLQGLLDQLNGGKFDININITFKLLK